MTRTPRGTGTRLRWPALAAQAALLGVIVIEAFFVKAIWDRMQLSRRAVEHPHTVLLSTLRSANLTVHRFGQADLAAYLVTAAVFLTWFFLAMRNARRYNPAQLTYKDDWAIAGWFVPVLNLWRPCLMTKEVWAAAALEPGSGESERKSPVTLRLWWGCLLVGIITARMWSPGSTTTLATYVTQSRLEIASKFLTILAALLAVIIVGRITALNDRRVTRR